MAWSSRHDNRGSQAVFTIGEVAKILRVSGRTVTKLVDSGQLKGYRLPSRGKDRRIERQHLIDFMTANKLPMGPLDAFCTNRILIVTDNPQVVEAVQAAPLDGETSYTHVSDSFHAGVSLTAVSPTAVVIDLGLGRWHGVTLLRGVRDQMANARVVAIPTEDDAHCAELANEFDAVLALPLQATNITAAIQPPTKPMKKHA